MLKALTDPLRSQVGSWLAQRQAPIDLVDRVDHRSAYTAHVDELKQGLTYDDAMAASVGGEFHVMGVIMRELLVMHGLRPDDTVIDVGCGSGRLTQPLSSYLTGHYVGLDVVEELVDYARNCAQRPDWRFEVTTGLDIDAADESADVVCFFSVLTHLLHQESYRYLREAKRVLRPGGIVVFSFLEFAIPSHWLVFELNVRTVGQARHHDQFISRDGIEKWAAELDLEIVALHDGDKNYIPIPEPLTMDSGQQFTDLATLGQSVCVLRKR